MDRVQAYLRRAEEAEAKAAAVGADLRRQFLDIARQWRELARQAGDLRDYPRASDKKTDKQS